MINILSIEIDNLSVRTQIGVPDEERAYQQTIIIDIACIMENVSIDDSKLSSTYNYSFLRKEILHLAETSRFRLLESFASAISELVFNDSRIRQVTVSIKKPSRFTDTQTVGIKATFKR